jgi:hypothetical protein
VYGLGNRGSLKGCIYDHWQNVEAFPDGCDIIYGLDFGFNVPTALVRVGIKENDVYVQQLIYEPLLTNSDLIKEMGNVQILYMPTGTMRSSTRAKQPGAIDALIIATVDGVVGWISPLNSYGIKIPLSALPESLNSFRTV